MVCSSLDDHSKHFTLHSVQLFTTFLSHTCTVCLFSVLQLSHTCVHVNDRNLFQQKITDLKQTLTITSISEGSVLTIFFSPGCNRGTCRALADAVEAFYSDGVEAVAFELSQDDGGFVFQSLLFPPRLLLLYVFPIADL